MAAPIVKSFVAFVVAISATPIALAVIFGLPLSGEATTPIEKPVYLSSSAKAHGPIKAHAWYLIARSDFGHIAMPTQGKSDCQDLQNRLSGTECLEGQEINLVMAQSNRGDL